MIKLLDIMLASAVDAVKEPFRAEGEKAPEPAKEPGPILVIREQPSNAETFEERLQSLRKRLLYVQTYGRAYRHEIPLSWTRQWEGRLLRDGRLHGTISGRFPYKPSPHVLLSWRDE